MADPNDPNAQLLPGIGSDVNFPLTGWTTNMQPVPGGGIGGDWRFPSQNVDPRLMPAPAPAMRPRVLRAPAPAPSLANTPMPPVRPAGLGAAQPAQPQGPLSFWDALRSLFSGGGQAQTPGATQGMTGMLNTPRGVDSLGNPVNRFG